MENSEQQTLETAITLFRKGSFVSALEKIDTISENLKSSMVFNLQGMCFSRIGKLEKAVDAYLNALNKDKDNAVVHNNLGNAYRDLGNISQSLKSFERAIAIRPDIADFYRTMEIAVWI